MNNTIEDVRAERERKAAEVRAALAQCYCTDNIYQHWMAPKFRYTDGVQTLARKTGAFWLIDAIVSHQIDKRLRTGDLEDFQLWELTVRSDSSCVLTCRADTNREPVVTQEIEYTDFPLDHIKLYLECGVLLLPSEH